ncbi:hypothetical protein Pelo_326 [Pelomyxa schiedti]|nr:hypothetical protein Pelo_326 [Pelomyxa schiedti]
MENPRVSCADNQQALKPSYFLSSRQPLGVVVNVNESPPVQLLPRKPGRPKGERAVTEVLDTEQRTQLQKQIKMHMKHHNIQDQAPQPDQLEKDLASWAPSTKGSGSKAEGTDGILTTPSYVSGLFKSKTNSITTNRTGAKAI